MDDTEQRDAKEQAIRELAADGCQRFYYHEVLLLLSLVDDARAALRSAQRDTERAAIDARVEGYCDAIKDFQLAIANDAKGLALTCEAYRSSLLPPKRRRRGSAAAPTPNDR